MIQSILSSSQRISRNAAIQMSRRTKSTQASQSQSQSQSSNFNPLEGDSGNIATHIHHKMTTFLAIATPLYLLIPFNDNDSTNTSTSLPNKAFGTMLAINFSAHSWIGLNYVVTDYIPKISKAMVGPARLVTAGIAGVTLLGLGKVAVNDRGGVKGAIGGLWNPSVDVAVGDAVGKEEDKN